MRIFFTLLLTALLYIFPAQLTAGENTDWEKSKDKNGIVIYTRESDASDIKAFKGITTTGIPIERLAKVLTDIPNFTEWCAKVVKSEIIKEISSDESIFYYELDFPVPFKSRDAVQHRKITTDSSTGIIRFDMKNSADALPEKDGKVRMDIAEGSWTLTPQANGKTEITYEYLADPAGRIPAWVVNMMIVDGPYESLSNLLKIAAAG